MAIVNFRDDAVSSISRINARDAVGIRQFDRPTRRMTCIRRPIKFHGESCARYGRVVPRTQIRRNLKVQEIGVPTTFWY